MAAYNIDTIIRPGAALRMLQYTADADLAAPDTTGSEPVAVISTENAGSLECTVGTLAFKTDGTIKWLTPSGWSDFA